MDLRAVGRSLLVVVHDVRAWLHMVEVVAWSRRGGYSHVHAHAFAGVIAWWRDIHEFHIAGFRMFAAVVLIAKSAPQGPGAR